MRLLTIMFRDQYIFRAVAAGLLAVVMFILMLVICG